MNMFKLKYFLAKKFALLNAKDESINHKVLMYHSIYKNKADRVDHFSVSLDNFVKHMKALKEMNIKVVHFGEHLKNEKSVSITFDDGFKDNLLLVAPIMEKLELPWTVFMVSDYLEGNYTNFLSENELVVLSKFRYVRIGAHGKTHTPMAQLSSSDYQSELKESKIKLEEVLGKEVDSMSFPHGSYNEEVLSKAKSCGYKFIGNSIPLPVSDDQFLNRYAIYDYDSDRNLRQKVLGKWDWMGRRMV